ncbi:hypothetical protein LCGC14_2753340, partial [marine sediment metagenome]
FRRSLRCTPGFVGAGVKRVGEGEKGRPDY